jgi:DTW domain-containing protein YfiP
VLVGEVFTPEVLRDHLWRPARDGRAMTPILLYPDASPDRADETNADADPTSLRLVVIDATWRKSLRMLHHNPLLQALPRLSLSDAAPSRYAIRKAPRAGQLSTLEATCHALARLEADGPKYAPLLDAFDGFVSMHGAHGGPAR